MRWPTFLRRATITSSTDKPPKAISACTFADHQFRSFANFFSSEPNRHFFIAVGQPFLTTGHSTMLVNQTVCHIPPQPTVLRDPSSRHSSPEWNIQRPIERQFAQARNAWVRYQSTRQRDAVYGYLSVVFDIVRRWKMLGHNRTCSRHALTATKHRCAIRTRDPFAIVIFCTSDPQVVDARTRSKWSRALRFAARCKPHAQELGAFIKSRGGVNECAARSESQIANSKASFPSELIVRQTLIAARA
jgi:hypothetical protein